MNIEYFGELEYSYTKGFREKMIINFYLDHRLQTLSKIREGDRVSIIYNFVDDEGLVCIVRKDIPKELKKTDYPKLVYSSGNKKGKIKVWYEVESETYCLLMLPAEIIGEQIPLRITRVKDGWIAFKAGKSRTIEEMAAIILTNSLQVISESEIPRVNELIRRLKSGEKINANDDDV